MSGFAKNTKKGYEEKNYKKRTEQITYSCFFVIPDPVFRTVTWTEPVPLLEKISF